MGLSRCEDGAADSSLIVDRAATVRVDNFEWREAEPAMPRFPGIIGPATKPTSPSEGPRWGVEWNPLGLIGLEKSEIKVCG